MIKNLFPAIRLTLVFAILFSVVYPVLVWTIAQLLPHQGMGLRYHTGGQTGYTLIGQKFDADRYFQSRPSATGYNAAGSGGSNKAPSNTAYVEEVKARLDSFLIHNPGVNRTEIPSDLLTASGSGIDPHISVQAAMVQIRRVAQARRLDESSVRQLVEQQIETPLWGVLGPKKISVLNLNLALDQLQQ